MDLIQANNVVISITSQYNALRHKKLSIPTPYFINTAEHIYKIAMRESGVSEDAVNSTIQYIKDGKSALGSTGGKGTPQQLEEDVNRLMIYLHTIGFNPDRAETIRKWMTHMHVGLDCSGYVYNVLLAVEKKVSENIIDKLAWVDPTNKKPSHAGVFIFDSNNLETISDLAKLQPLDILMTKNHTHIGLLAFNNDTLCLVDCSMGNNGITYSPIKFDKSKIVVEGHDWWSRHFDAGDILVKRI